MTSPPPPHPHDQPDPIAIAVAIATALGETEKPATVQQLLDGADPVFIVTVLARTLAAALDATVGEEGRRTVLQHLGLGAARDEGGRP